MVPNQGNGLVQRTQDDRAPTSETWLQIVFFSCFFRAVSFAFLLLYCVFLFSFLHTSDGFVLGTRILFRAFLPLGSALIRQVLAVFSCDLSPKCLKPDGASRRSKFLCCKGAEVKEIE
jgi:hypothetical protein